MIELLLQAERALSIGRLDQAETLYRQVANADPRNSIAVVGLSRVALDRGDEGGALELARRALIIDPENVAAQRMVTRLEEVLEYRGEAVEPVAVEAIVTEAEPEPVAPEPEPASPEPEPEPEPEARPAAPSPEPKAAPKPPSPAAPEPAGTLTEPPRRRSWFSRLFRRWR